MVSENINIFGENIPKSALLRASEDRVKELEAECAEKNERIEGLKAQWVNLRVECVKLGDAGAKYLDRLAEVVGWLDDSTDMHGAEAEAEAARRNKEG